LRPRALLCFSLVVVALAVSACDQRARRVLSVAPGERVKEGERVQVAITIKNVYPTPLIPLSLSLYARPDPAEYIVLRQTLGEVEYTRPLQATEVRNLQTLGRIEADHIRDDGQWRHVPDSRFLHPRILLPGQSLTETFQFQALQSHRKLLACDLYFMTLAGAPGRGRLFVRTKPEAVPPDADRYTEVFSRVDEATLDDPSPQPDKYLLYRPARIHDQPPRLVSRGIRLKVDPQAFPYREAARRARFGARRQCYFAAAGAWAFEYADDGTWFVGQGTITKLKGHYAELIDGLDRRQATALTLTAPRRGDDKLLAHLQKAGYCDPAAEGPNAVATIPVEQLLPLLEQAETLGYIIQPTTWKPIE